MLSKRRVFFLALINDSGDIVTRCEIADPNDNSFVFIGNVAILLVPWNMACKSERTVDAFNTSFPRKENYIFCPLDIGHPSSPAVRR